MQLGEPISQPVRLEVTFFIERPKKTKWPTYPAGTPDLSKLIRAIEDSITQAGLWADDALVVEVRASKRWTGTTPDTYPVSGARISVIEL